MAEISKICVAVAATQTRRSAGTGIGHNNGPAIEPFGLRAAWLHFANRQELRRLAKLHMRIQRRQRGLDDLVAERKRIMNRCIRRMRRSDGKN